MPSVSARCASSTAYSPGSEISARFALAPSSERGGSAGTAPLDATGAASSASAASSAPSPPPCTAITTSVGVASHSSPSAARFAAVPIATSARDTPSCPRTTCATCISRTLST
jgi:hypothetical protein